MPAVAGVRGLALSAFLVLAPTVGAGAAGIVVESPDERCMPLPGPFPPGIDLVADDPGAALVANFAPGVVIPVNVESEPPEPEVTSLIDLRGAIASDACGASRDPAFDGVFAVGAGLALITASSCESVAFVDPATGALRDLQVSTPASFPPGAFIFNPAPGTSESRAAISTRACVIPPAPALDSFGEPIPPGCEPSAPSYFLNFTSGAALVGDALFVSTSNLGAGAGTFETQFLPGAVLVFDLDAAAAPPTVSPNEATPIIFTSGFNPTHVTPYTTPGGRELVLVTVSGATGLVSNREEGEIRGLALTDAAIDAIDVTQRRLVATIPLGLAALSFERLAIDPSGRVALVGSSVARNVFAVDLAPLDALAPADPFTVIEAAIFDADAPLVLPALPGGAPPETCAGFVVGIDFGGDGHRAYATDFCDGTLTSIAVDLAGNPPAPVPADRFWIDGTLELVAPVPSPGLPRALGTVRVRPGTPGEDFQGPDTLFVVGEPEGLLCSVLVPEPSIASLRIAAAAALAALAARRRRINPESTHAKEKT